MNKTTTTASNLILSDLNDAQIKQLVLMTFQGEELPTSNEDVGELEEYGDYLVLTDSEADEAAKDAILDSAWAFNPSFLSSETGIDEEVFEAIQDNGRCESNNDAILSCIADEDSFVEAAIAADGRGHFLATYDGNENEQEFNGQTYYIYRTN